MLLYGKKIKGLYYITIEHNTEKIMYAQNHVYKSENIQYWLISILEAIGYNRRVEEIKMKKVKEEHSNKDRIICVTIPNHLQFFYQAEGSRGREYLFETDFSGSVFAYFRERGCKLSDQIFSISIRELYTFRDYHNVRLRKTLERLPILIDYVLRENRLYALEQAGLVYDRVISRDCAKYAA